MAIKGKSKSRGAKSVARGPKPAYVPVRTPVLRRRGLWIAIGSVAGAALLAALAIAFVQQRNETREQDRLERMAVAANQLRGSVDPVLRNVGEALPPIGFDAFPQLTTAIEGLEAERVEDAAVEEAVTTGDGVAESAETALASLEGIDTTDLVSGQDFPRDFVLNVINARDRFADAMSLYRESGLLLVEAGGADDDLRGALVDRARGILDVAELVFQRGYTDYINAQDAAGVFLPLGATGVSGLTGSAP